MGRGKEDKEKAWEKEKKEMKMGEVEGKDIIEGGRGNKKGTEGENIERRRRRRREWRKRRSKKYWLMEENQYETNRGK